MTPPAGAPNQTVTIQVTGQSWGANSNDLTVQDQIFLNLTVNYVPIPGGGGGNKTATHNPIPGTGPIGVAVAATLAMLVAVRKRKWTDCRR